MSSFLCSVNFLGQLTELRHFPYLYPLVITDTTEAQINNQMEGLHEQDVWKERPPCLLRGAMLQPPVCVCKLGGSPHTL